jgi:hypothetical protein
MADNYDDLQTSDTYGYSEEDMNGGGEQIASAIYVNEQIAQQTAVVMTKQNAIVLQPTTPPLNPQVGDMWIDTNIYPNIIYTWDGTQWNRATVTSADEVGAYSIAQTDDLINNVQIDTTAVSNRVDVTEQQLADGEGLASLVTKSTTYANDVAGQVSSGINNFVAGLQDDASIAQKLPLFARQSDLTRTANDIQAKFASGGGVNLLKNSVGYGGLLNWQVTSGAVSQYIGSDCIDAGSGFAIATGVMKQAVSAVVGQPYTITAKVKKGTAGTAYLKISDGTNFQQVDFIASQAYDYQQVQIAGFIPQSNSIIIEIGATGASAIFTVLMLNKGTIGLQWSHANGEMYNGAVTFDINGVRVNSSVYDGYTVMSPSEFSGYYRNNQGVMTKVFTLNKDTTEVSKLKLTDPAATVTMGTMQMIYINGGGHRGWAFIPSS